MEISNSFAHREPLTFAIGFVVKRAKDLEVSGIADGRFYAENASGFVVHLDGVACQPVFDANSFDPVLEAGDDLSREVARRFLSKEPHHVRAFESAHRVANERRIDLG